MWVRIARFEGAQSVDEPVEEVRERMKAGMAQAESITRGCTCSGRRYPYRSRKR